MYSCKTSSVNSVEMVVVLVNLPAMHNTPDRFSHFEMISEPECLPRSPGLRVPVGDMHNYTVLMHSVAAHKERRRRKLVLG